MKGAVPTQEFIEGAFGRQTPPHFEDAVIRVYRIRSPSAVEASPESDTIEADGGLQVTVKGVNADGRHVPLAKEWDRNLLGHAVWAPAKGNSLYPAPPLAFVRDVHAAFRDSERAASTDLKLEEREVARREVDGEAQRRLGALELDQPRGETRSNGRIVASPLEMTSSNKHGYRITVNYTGTPGTHEVMAQAVDTNGATRDLRLISVAVQ
jgi:hypothetical protein